MKGGCDIRTLTLNHPTFYPTNKVLLFPSSRNRLYHFVRESRLAYGFSQIVDRFTQKEAFVEVFLQRPVQNDYVPHILC
jgi:hypothetical protein